MTNAYQWLGSIQSEGKVYNAMGTGKVAPVAAEDIAAVAVHALTDPNPLPEIFEVTGGELLTVADQVNILAEARKKAIETVEIPTEAAIQNLIRIGTPPVRGNPRRPDGDDQRHRRARPRTQAKDLSVLGAGARHPLRLKPLV
jgi:uncharacterized protein YbjT (DUF2867 family)